MADFEDYYEILQVHFLAEPEVIKRAFAALANKYHPDRNTGAGAAARMQKINIAYGVLSDPGTRRLYDAEWIKSKQPANPRADKPRPAVEPNTIEFMGVVPKETQRSSFLILNTGGNYKRIWFSNPNSWVRVVNYFSLADSDELPLKVEIEAAGEEWDKDYVESLKVRLDDEEIQVRIALTTRKQPVNRSKPAPKRKTVRRRGTIWPKWTAGLVVVAIAALAVAKLVFPSIEAGGKVADTIAPAVAPTPAPVPYVSPPASTPWPPAAQLELKQIDLYPVANFSTDVDSFPSGAQTFNGIGFSMVRNIFMTRCSAAYLPNEGVLTLDIVHPQDVFILINTTAAYTDFTGKQTGKITLEFDNGAAEETDLIAGQNIREYTVDNTVMIRTVYDPANQVAWQGGADRRFIIDMLAIPIDPRNQAGSLKRIIITDTSERTANSVDPGLIVWALTIAHAK